MVVSYHWIAVLPKTRGVVCTVFLNQVARYRGPVGTIQDAFWNGVRCHLLELAVVSPQAFESILECLLVRAGVAQNRGPCGGADAPDEFLVAL